MNITDGMIEAGAKSLALEYRDRYYVFLGLTAAKDMTRACLTAALGAQETPLEEVLGRQWKVMELYSYADGRWSAYVEEMDGYEGRYGEATADTPSAAIRDAVRNATEGE